MKNIFICLFALLFLSNCTDDKDELIIGAPYNEGASSKPSLENGIEKRIFDVINLDYPGLEEVKRHYQAEEYYEAVNELLNYYRLRDDVINPNISLISTTATASEQNIAEQALDYKFYIRNFQEKKGDTEAENVYYSFKDNSGKINWEFIPKGITDKEFQYQLHRHQWMVPQAKTYRITQDESYVKSWIAVYSDWMNKYPCPEGITPEDYYQWIGLQVAERVTSQIELMTYYMYSPNFTPSWLSIFLNQFANEVENIRKNYYTDSNILVTQAYAVTLAGILLPEFKNANEWLSEGVAKLNEQVAAQFNKDGVHYEFDPSYHIGAISDFYNIYEIAQLNNKADKFPANYLETLRKPAEFVMDITYPDYTMENFNDTRSSRLPKSVLIKNFKRYAKMFPDHEGLKWMATEGKEGKAPTYLTKKYDASGYYILRNNWDTKPQNVTMFILKNNDNPLGRWHCQPDNGTFSLFHNGRNFFPDSGVYGYEGEPKREDYRQTKWHNTMTIFANNIEKTKGKFLKMETQGNTDVLITENEAYSALTHRRSVFYVNKEFFVLVDEGYGTENGKKYNLNFNLCPGTDNQVVLDLTENGAHTAFEDGNNIILRTFTAKTITDATTSFNGQTSNEFHESVARKGYTVTLRKSAQEAARFITVIYPVSDASKATLSAEFTDEGFNPNGASIKVTVNDKEYNLSYTL